MNAQQMEGYSVFLVKRINTVKMPLSPKGINIFNAIPVKIPRVFFKQRKKNCMKSAKIHYPATSLLDIYPKNTETLIQKDICTRVLIMTL